MTLAELKQKCESNNWEIKKISEQPARMYQVRRATLGYVYGNGKRSHTYNTYVRRKCSTCKKEVMKDIRTYRNKNFKPISGQCMFGKPQRSFCSDECRIIGISETNHYMHDYDKVYIRKKGGYAMMKRYDHPNKNNENLVSRARLIVEKQIGRYLVPFLNGKGELIHHINMDKCEDKYENLLVCDGASIHQELHGTYNKLCKPFMDLGIIEFDAKEGYYVKEEIWDLLKANLSHNIT